MPLKGHCYRLIASPVEQLQINCLSWGAATDSLPLLGTRYRLVASLGAPPLQNKIASLEAPLQITLSVHPFVITFKFAERLSLNSHTLTLFFKSHIIRVGTLPLVGMSTINVPLFWLLL